MSKTEQIVDADNAILLWGTSVKYLRDTVLKSLITTRSGSQTLLKTLTIDQRRSEESMTKCCTPRLQLCTCCGNKTLQPPPVLMQRACHN